MKDLEIIDLIRKREHHKAIEKLYDHFPKVKSLIRLKGGNVQDAGDVFQESLVIFCRKVSNPEFILTCSIGTYLYSISWHLWKDTLRKKNRSVSDPWKEASVNAEAETEEYLEKEKKYGYLDQVLTQIGDKCREIFKLYYFQKQSMEEIASVLGFGSEQSAKNQKYKCMEKARVMAKEMLIQS
ncbi:MAG: RNA polymerase sigma factor [Bacteroidia bacterium]